MEDQRDQPHSSLPSNAIPREINLLTLNCWGIRHISALRQPRIIQIGRELAATASPSPSSSRPSSLSRPDIVCLQELFTQEDYHTLRRETRQILPYGKFYHSGPFGGGLVVLSRWPIDESSMLPYPLNGRPTAFWRGDWYVGKGVAHARVRLGPGPGDVIEVFNTHTHSPYESACDVDDNHYRCHRIAQAWELAKLVRGAAERGHLVAALGDFNMLPMSLAHRLITSHAPVRDAWRVLHPESSLGPSFNPVEAARRLSVPSAEFNLTENGASSNNILNTWRWDKAQLKKLKAGNPCDIDPNTPDPNGQRLDYIFVSTGQPAAPGGGADALTPGWVVKSAAVALTDRHPGLGVSLSDHFAVQATITHHTPDPQTSTTTGIRPATPASRPATPSTDALRSGAFLAPPDTPTSSSNARSTVAVPESDYDAQLSYRHGHHDALPLSVYDDILNMIHKYAAREEKEQHWRGIHFYASLVIWLACLVGVWFTPNYASFILLLVSGLSLVAGAINGLLALLFFGSELRALEEFEWEIRNAKAAASGELVVLTEESQVMPKQDRRRLFSQ